MSGDQYGKTDYTKVSHDELFNQLRPGGETDDAGRLRALDNVAGIYQTQQSGAHTLAGDIAGDLRKLQHVWKGEAFDAYNTAVGAISTFAGKLGDDFGATYQAMTGLKPHLQQALKDMPNPK